jgi:drug/metabolite transporter (DMT)-like permease
VLYSAVVAQTLGHFAWFRALSYLSPVIAALISLANPVVGVLASVWITGEPLTWRKLAALVFILISLFIIVVGPAGLRALRLRKTTPA